MDVASQAEALNKALEEPAPNIDPAPDTVVSLYVGLPGAEGDWQTTAIVRELTGADEEALASFEVKEGLVYAEFMSFLLKRAVESIGNFKVSQNPEVIDQLVVGDRDRLFMGIIQATYGVQREYEVDCPSCAESNDVFIDTRAFPDKPLKKSVIGGRITVTLKDGTEVTLRLPNGADSVVSGKGAKTTAEQNTLILSRCVQGIEGDPARWAKSLSMADRGKVIKQLLGAQPGPEIWEVKAQCAHCGHEFEMALDWASLLFG